MTLPSVTDPGKEMFTKFYPKQKGHFHNSPYRSLTVPLCLHQLKRKSNFRSKIKYDWSVQQSTINLKFVFKWKQDEKNSTLTRNEPSCVSPVAAAMWVPQLASPTYFWLPGEHQFPLQPEHSDNNDSTRK